MSENVVVLGIDHGYANMKTVHCVFPSGLTAYAHEPYTKENVLEIGGKFYVVGSGRQALQRDKTACEDYYLLTLAAIAKEIESRKLERNLSVHLAAGLPLTSFGRDKQRFREYLLRDGQLVQFRYEGRSYAIRIREVSLFPQGYAAILMQRDLLDEPSVIAADIGGWTVDLMRLDRQIPNAASCRSLEQGLIGCLNNMAEQARRNLGLSPTAAQIESVLRGENPSLPQPLNELIHNEARAYVQNLLSAITESGLDVRAMPAVFMGGGASLLKRYAPAADSLCRAVILDDILLNAKGYEALQNRLNEQAEQVKNG